MKKLFLRPRMLVIFFSAVALCLCFAIIMPKSAGALALNPDPGSTVPEGNKDYLRECDNPTKNPGRQTPSVTPWLSSASNTGARSITVPYGTTSVQLRVNMAGVICFTHNNTQSLKGKFHSTAPENIGLDNATLHVNWWPTPTDPGTFRHASTEFTYRPAGGFTKSGTYFVHAEFQSINEGLFGSFYQCVGGSEGFVDNIDDFRCDRSPVAYDIYVNVTPRPPQGWIDDVVCDLNSTNPAYATGWVWDPDAPTPHTAYVKIYTEAYSLYGGRLVGEGPADIVRPDLGAFPGARGFRIDVSAFKDAYRHNLYAEVTNSNGENKITVLSGGPRAGPCALPRCGAYTSTPARPEVGERFTGRATYTYSPGSRGWAVNGDMGLDINHARRGTITFHSPSGVYNWNGGPIPPGANRTNQISVSDLVINSPGPYAVGWPMQWLINGNDTELKNVLRAHPVYDWYLAGNGNTYATLICPESGEAPQPLVVSKPYVRIYGNDIHAGGNLRNQACRPENDKATILTFANGQPAPNFSTENWRGSSTQFAAYALGEVASFMSAGQNGPRQNSTSGPNGNSQARPVLDLTFGNYNRVSQIVNLFPGANTSLLDVYKTEGYGGMSDMVACVDDYYQAVSTRGGTASGPNTGGNRVINDAVAEYRNGDVVINGNIDFSSAPWADGDIPSYYLVVRGNIYINSDVERISGVFVAQDDGSGNKGRIYTCSSGSTLYQPGALYTNCNRRLTINGAFVAKQVKFLRSIDTVLAGQPNEPMNSSRAAEIFNFSPETYLANPHPSLRNGSQKVQYDFITSLPPIL